MRFATFNISSGRSAVDGQVELGRFADAIAGLDADVLSLQEVDRNQPRSQRADLTEVAAAAMGAAHRVFVPALYGTPGGRWVTAADPAGASMDTSVGTWAGGPADDRPAYGCALLSRHPLRKVEVVRMTAAPIALPLWVPGPGVVVVREEPRVAIVAEVELGPGRDVTVVGTHLPFVPLWNRRQLARVVAAVRARPDPLLLLGDLNLRGATPARLTGFQALVSAPTFPATRPRFQLDHVLLRGGWSGFGRVVATSSPLLRVSDHRPLVIDVELDAAPVFGRGAPCAE